MNILIIGQTGTGKSTLGKNLNIDLGYTLIELEASILQRSGFKHYKKVYEKSQFLWKEIELELSKELSKHDNQIIVTGGGFIENKLNFDYFTYSPFKPVIICLTSSLDVLINRLKEKSPHSPLDDNEALLKEKLLLQIDQRKLFYERLKDKALFLDTSINPPEQTARDALLYIKA